MNQSRTNIPDPYRDTPLRDRVALSYYLRRDAHEYLTKKVFGGTPGAMNAVVTTLLNLLVLECQKANITQWEPENEQRIIELLGRASFTPATKRAPSRRTNADKNSQQNG